MDQWPADELKVIIRADRRPPGEHERRFNAPTTNEIAAVIVGNEFETRDIVLRRRDETLVRVAETHRFYDALQYPLIFWKGQEGYHFCIPPNNPANNQPVYNKKITSLQFYCFHLMVRNGSFSIHLYKQLLNQFVVDMFVKIESERLHFIKKNQGKLRAENYIHLQDAIAVDGTTNPNNLGQVVILPSTFTGSPRYMHEHAQDALAYVRHYGRPDLFITMTCNPKWEEITSELFPGQKATGRHDVVARVFRQKIIKFIAVITKGEIFGSVRCWMYTVEWQKRGLPHIHVLIWLSEQIQPNKIDDIIKAEIPDNTVDPLLYDIVIKNMVHGPCCNLNPNSPCMKHGKCTKGYPKSPIKETQTNENGYPLYRRRSPDDGGRIAHINMTATGNNPVQIDNTWIVPYSPLLSKLFNAHINVEICSSVKSIKYICKYINKGSDQAVFVLQGEVNQHNRLDEVEMYQSGRYVSSNEAFWRIFSFHLH
ncbi:uncharacterized protein LOC128984403 [Macrosteles quadrilineatus]|uniref:uncharacterized protein LOC128984403 n=1 Tax=Macrosteles quadrilineatus TaxID=74068 RepID=UPI0023E1A272|nr:uncharacterized protein LOC128984403 [Macrosteles quadrilineatus]